MSRSTAPYENTTRSICPNPNSRHACTFTHTHTHEHTNWSYCIAKHVLLFKPCQNISDLRNYTKRPFEVANDPPFWACKSSKFSCSLTSSLKNATMQQVCDRISNGSILGKIFLSTVLCSQFRNDYVLWCNNTAVFGLTWLNSAAQAFPFSRSKSGVKVFCSFAGSMSEMSYADISIWPQLWSAH